MCFNTVLLFFYFICEISSSEEIETPPSATLRIGCEECLECVNSDPLSGSAYSFWRTPGWQVHSPSGIHCILMILLEIFHILKSFFPYHSLKHNPIHICPGFYTFISGSKNVICIECEYCCLQTWEFAPRFTQCAISNAQWLEAVIGDSSTGHSLPSLPFFLCQSTLLALWPNVWHNLKERIEWLLVSEVSSLW